MTDRLYYSNSYLAEFDATVVAVRGEGGQPQVALDRSAFYPSSGGQPNDTGLLGGWRVTDVNADEGVVWHTLETAGAGPVAGDLVHGSVDWARRFDHMQQHTGQHLLSQVFERLYGYETVSVHIGADENTLDLETPALGPGQVAEAESLACDQVYAALPVRAYLVDEAGLAAVPLRKPPKVSGVIRIVEIEQYDYSACGGTHCRSTAEVGPIKIVRTEKRRGIVRVTFLCGRRAFADYQRKHRLLVEVASVYSTDLEQAPVLAERNLAQVKELQRRVDEVNGRLLEAEAGAMIATARPFAGDARLVSVLRDDVDAAGLRTLASALIATPGVVALLGSQQNGKLLIVFARHADAPGHMGNLMREVLSGAGGSGGGRPEFAQGGGVDAEHGPGVLEAARERLMSEVV